jgi:NAD(P)H-flavin reductase
MSSFPEPITSTKSKLQIVEKKAINHDSYIYSLKWAGPKFKFDIGQHFRIIQHLKTNDHP